MHNITTFVIHLYSLAEIAKIVDGTLHGDGTLTVTTISTDTRKIWQPDSCLFIAISTSKNNGHHYLAQVDKQGVAAAIVSGSSYSKHQLYHSSRYLESTA